MRTRTLKKALSLFLSLVMMLSLLPTFALAAGERWDTLTLTRDGVPLAEGADYTVTEIKSSPAVLGFATTVTAYKYTITTTGPVTLSGGCAYPDVRVNKSNKSEVIFANGAETQDVTLDGVTCLGNLTAEAGKTLNVTLKGTNNVDYIYANGFDTSVVIDGNGTLNGKQIGSKIGTNCGSITINAGTYNLDNSASTADATIGSGKNGKVNDITINGGTINAKAAYGAAIGSGQGGEATNIVITDGKIAAEATYAAAIGSGKGGKATAIAISGGEVKATAGFGAAIGSGHEGSLEKVEISGGKIDASAYPGVAIGVGTNKATSEKVAISSGEFKTVPDEDYIVVGAEIIVDGKTYTKTEEGELKEKQEAPTVTGVAEVNGVGYETLAAAIDAAKSGEIITLLADFENIVRVSLPAGVTLDGNGHKITGASGIYIPAAGATVKNIKFENIHNNAPVGESDIKTYGWTEGKTGTQSAIYSENLTGTATITECSFDSVDWDAIQVSGTVDNNAKIIISNNVFKHTEVSSTQIRYIHIQPSGIYGSNVDVTINGNEFYKTKNTADTAITTIGIWNVGYDGLHLTGNYFEYTGDVVYTDATISQGLYGNDCKRLFPAIDNNGQALNYVTLAGNVAYLNEAAPAIKGDDDVYITFADAITADDTDVALLKDVAADNVVIPEGVTLKINSNEYKLTGSFTNNGTLNLWYGDGKCEVTVTNKGKVIMDCDAATGYTVNGGTVEITDGEVYDLSKITNADITISGGTFTTKPDEALLKDFYIAEEDGDYYTVRQMTKAEAAEVAVAYEGYESSPTYLKTLETISDYSTYLLKDVENGKAVWTGTKTYGSLYSNGHSFTGSIDMGLKNSVRLYGDKFTLTNVTGKELDVGSYNTVAEVTIRNATLTKLVVQSLSKCTIEGGKYDSITVYTRYANKTATEPSQVGELTITGGLFKTDAVTHTIQNHTPGSEVKHLSDYVPEDYKVVTLAESDEGYVDGYRYKVVPDVTYVAQIGETKYETLQAAVDAAKTGDTIKLLADIDVVGPGITVQKQITIDFNDKEIEAKDSDYVFAILAEVTLKNGGITGYSYYSDGNKHTNSLVLVQDGNLTLDNMSLDGAYYAVRATYGTNIVKICGNSYVYGDNTAIYWGSDSTVNLESGKIDGEWYCFYGDGTLNMTGGEVVNEYEDAFAILAGSGAKINIHGGSISSGYRAIAAVGGEEDLSIIVDGGELYAGDAVIFAQANCGKLGTADTRVPYKVNITINGGKLSSEAYGVAVLGKGAVLNVTGGEIYAKENYAISGNGTHSVGESDYSGTVINIRDGKITSEEDAAIYHPQYGELNITGGEITGLKSAVEMRAGNLNVKGGTITSTGDPASVDPNESGSTTVGCAVAVSQHTTMLPINVNITGGELKGVYAFREVNPQENPNTDLDKIALGVSGGKFDGTVESVYTKNFITGGYFKSNPAAFVFEGYKVVANDDAETKEAYPYKVVPDVTYVAQIGDVKYETLAAAVAAAQDGDKIELLANIELTETVSVAKQITLDLGEFNITPADNGLTANSRGTKDALIAVNYGGDLTITGTTGKISSNNIASVYAAVKMTEKGESAGEEPARLTVNSGTLEGYYYGISGNGTRHNTEVTINGGVIKGMATDDSAGIYNPQDGSLAVNGGTIEGASGIYVKAGTVTVFTGGTIKGVGSDTAFVHSGNGFNPTGAAFVVENCGYPGGTPNVMISGSTFLATNGDAVESYGYDSYTALTGFITGGFFSSNVQSLVATGHKAYKVADKLWTVGVDDQTQKAEIPTDTELKNAVKVEGTTGITAEQAQQKVKNTIENNTAVNSFVNSDIKAATTSNTTSGTANLKKVKEALEAVATEETATAISKLTNDVDLSSYIKVRTEAATVANFTVHSATTVTGTTVTSMTFDVKPYAEYTVKNGDQVVETVTAVIPNDAITSPITFRLPVEDSVPTGTIVEVFHSNDKPTSSENKGSSIGKFKVQAEGGKKFIELASKEFSYFTYELTEEVIGSATFSATLNLADSIGIIMYVNHPTGTLDKYEVTATYKGGSTTTTLSESPEVAEGKYQILIADCAAAEMFETVHVVVTYDGINIKEFNYSVYDYCNNKINNSGTVEGLKELCRAALDYGCYARTFFGYTEMVSACSGYSPRSVSAVTVTGIAASKSVLCTGIQSVSATLSLESRTEIIFYLTPENGYTEESYTYSVSGGDLIAATPEATIISDGRIRVRVKGIAAAKLGEEYTLTVTPTNSEESMTVSYSPMTYANSKQTSSTADLPNLVKSLYQYYLGAKDFF